MINKELPLAHADTQFTSTVKTEQPEVVPLYIKADHVRKQTWKQLTQIERKVKLENIIQEN